MKTSYIFLFLFIYSISYSASPKVKSLIGFWKLIKTQNVDTKETNVPDKSVYYHFHSDNTLTMTDTYSRERSNWTWSLVGDKLIIQSSTFNNIRIIGYVSFLDKTKLLYKVSSSSYKTKYLWTFERL